MPDRPSLTAQKRTVFGNRLGQLRRSGVIPANLVVPGADSVPLQLDEHEMATHLRKLGRGGLVELKMSGDIEVALLQDVDIHPVSSRLQHVIFRHVDMTQPIEVPVSLQFTGDAPADTISGVYVVHEMDEVRVRCLPDSIPQEIVADVSELESAGDSFRIEDLEPIDGVEFLDEAETPIAVVHLERLEEEVDELEEGLLDVDAEVEEGGEAAGETADEGSEG
jgi:large subunit ribosomal protein L25